MRLIKKLLRFAYYAFICTVGGVFVRVFWLKKISGISNIPKENVIFAFNHTSYLDFLAFTPFCPHRLSFLTAESFFEKWYWAPFIKWTKQVRVDRDKINTNVLRELADRLSENYSIGIFPEGTRSIDGKLQKTHVGAAWFAKKFDLPIVPVGITGAFELWPRTERFPKLGRLIEIKIGHPILYKEGSSPEEMTARTMAQIGELVEQRYQT